MDLDKAIQNRKSVRKFSSRKPDWRDIIECVDASRYAPAAAGNFISKFIVVSDKEKIQKIADAAQQDFIAQAHYVVVVCTNDLRLTNQFGKKGGVYARQQAGAAIQNFLLKAEEKGLDCCWVGQFVESQIKDILKIPDNAVVEAVFPVGYEYKKNAVSAKIDLNRILFFDKYGNEKMNNPKKLDV